MSDKRKGLPRATMGDLVEMGHLEEQLDAHIVSPPERPDAGRTSHRARRSEQLPHVMVQFAARAPGLTRSKNATNGAFRASIEISCTSYWELPDVRPPLRRPPIARRRSGRRSRRSMPNGRTVRGEKRGEHCGEAGAQGYCRVQFFGRLMNQVRSWGG